MRPRVLVGNHGHFLTSGSNARPRNHALVILTAALLLVASGIASPADETRDLIVVMDVSTSMLDLFDRAKAEAKQFVASARLGDRVTIITFGRSSHLRERSRINSAHDIARILSEIDDLQPTEYATNLTAGMDWALQEMKQFYEESPERNRQMLWLSDGKDNPPKDIPNLITLTSLKQRETSRLPDHNWFLFRAPIEPEAKSDVQWFIDWASRTGMRLDVQPLASDFGTLLAPELAKSFAIRFEPNTPAARGTSFSVVAELTEKDGAPYSMIIPVTPDKIICSGTRWDQDLRLIFPDRPGNYVCKIGFVLPSDKLLAISPPQITLKAIVQPQVKTIEQQVVAIDTAMSAAYRQSVEKQSVPETAFRSKARAELNQEPSLSVPVTTLRFGPIVPRTQYRASVALFPTRNVPLDSLSMKATLALPSGLDLRPNFRINGGTLTADLRLVADGSFAVNDGWETQGTLSFVSADDSIRIYPTDIRVRFYAEKRLARWGKRELSMGSTYEQIGTVMRVATSYAAKAVKGLLIALALWALYYLIRRFGFPSTELVGTLEIVKNPTDRKIKTFNLRRIGKFRTTNSLTVGSSGKADIVLPHPSVADLHAKITTAKTAAGTIVFVQPLHYNRILVNDVSYALGKEIGDKDLLSIGEFVLLYKCPEVSRETIVRFATGKFIRGILISWDIEATSFEFLPKGAPSLDAKMVVQFSELKAVFLIRKSGRFSGNGLFGAGSRPSGHPVEVIFKDGELLEGYMVGETAEWSKRFYVIPKDQGQIALVLVERSAVQNLFMRGAFEKAPFEVRRFLQNIGARIRL